MSHAVASEPLHVTTTAPHRGGHLRRLANAHIPFPPPRRVPADRFCAIRARPRTSASSHRRQSPVPAPVGGSYCTGRGASLGGETNLRKSRIRRFACSNPIRLSAAASRSCCEHCGSPSRSWVSTGIGRMARHGLQGQSLGSLR